jgi:hypothetical protein
VVCAGALGADAFERTPGVWRIESRCDDRTTGGRAGCYWTSRIETRCTVSGYSYCRYDCGLLDGVLSSLWPRPEQALALGWTANLARQYLSLLDAPAACPVNPEHVVSVIGRRDTVLPFESGRSLLAQWGVPKANIFEWDRGHFTVPATMIRTREPVERLARIMSVDAA